MGDSGASGDWGPWFDENAPSLVLYARQWLPSIADAEDVVQDAFVRFWRVGRHAADDPKAYLFASVRRAALDARRGQARRERREDEAGRRPPPVESVFGSSMERDEWRASVEAALARLPDAQREVLVLKVWGELAFPQIAEVVGVSPNTVGSRYRYALDALRRQLSEEAVP